MERERPLHPHPERDLPDRERLADPSARTTDHDALEDLDTLAIALDDADVDLHGVTRAEIRDVVAQEGLLDQIGLVHGRKSSVPAAFLSPVATSRARRSLREPLVAEIGTVPPGLLDRRVASPPVDLAVVPRDQDLRHRHPAELLRPRVVGMIEEAT